MILEFIVPFIKLEDYTMPVLQDLLICLSPDGNEFFKGYIQMKPQWMIQVDKCTKIILASYI